MMIPRLVAVTRLATLIAIAFGASCKTDITTISFDLPPRTYDFNTSNWNVPASAAMLPVVSCTDTATCCAAAMPFGIDCGIIVCDAPSGSCAVTVTVETPPQTLNLKAEVPALSSLGSSQSLADITISKIMYDIDPNTMNVDLPEVELYLADNGAMSTTDASAKKFGTVPPTMAMTPVHGGQVILDPAGQAAFAGYAHNFGTPFVFLSRITAVIPGGTPLPMGEAKISVTGRISVKPSLF